MSPVFRIFGNFFLLFPSQQACNSFVSCTCDVRTRIFDIHMNIRSERKVVHASIYSLAFEKEKDVEKIAILGRNYNFLNRRPISLWIVEYWKSVGRRDRREAYRWEHFFEGGNLARYLLATIYLPLPGVGRRRELSCWWIGLEIVDYDRVTPARIWNAKTETGSGCERGISSQRYWADSWTTPSLHGWSLDIFQTRRFGGSFAQLRDFDEQPSFRSTSGKGQREGMRPHRSLSPSISPQFSGSVVESSSHRNESKSLPSTSPFSHRHTWSRSAFQGQREGQGNREQARFRKGGRGKGRGEFLNLSSKRVCSWGLMEHRARDQIKREGFPVISAA